MHSQVDALNHRSLANFKDVRSCAMVTGVENGHVMFVVSDVMIDDAITSMNPLQVAVTFLLDRLFQSTAIITTLHDKG